MGLEPGSGLALDSKTVLTRGRPPAGQQWSWPFLERRSFHGPLHETPTHSALRDLASRLRERRGSVSQGIQHFPQEWQQFAEKEMRMPGEHSRGCLDEVGASWPSKSRVGFWGEISGDWSQSEEGGQSRSWQRREGTCQVCRGLKPEFTLDVTEVRSHGTFLSKGVAAGKGSRLGWAEEERCRRVVAISLCSNP